MSKIYSVNGSGYPVYTIKDNRVYEGNQYEKLLQEKAEADKEKLFEAYEKSRRSLDEIVDYMRGKADV